MRATSRQQPAPLFVDATPGAKSDKLALISDADPITGVNNVKLWQSRICIIMLGHLHVSDTHRLILLDLGRAL
jgi:hypothetical protein